MSVSSQTSPCRRIGSATITRPPASSAPSDCPVLLNYEEDDEYEGFPVHNADLWFNLNYLQPTYFAWESLPVVEDLTKKFDLLVFDPQNWDQAAPCPFDYEALLKTWKEGNLFALRGVDKKPPFLSPDRSEVLWKYLRSRKDLRAQMGMDLFVPALGVVKRNPGDTILQIMTLWNDAIPQVFPPYDLVLVGRQRKLAIFGEKWESDVIPYTEIMDMFGEYMEPFNVPVPGMKVLWPDRARQVEAMFKQLKLYTRRKSFLLRTGDHVGASVECRPICAQRFPSSRPALQDTLLLNLHPPRFPPE